MFSVFILDVSVYLYYFISVPHAPRGLTATMTNTTVELKWSEPSVSTGPITGYRVHWKNWTKEGEIDTGSTNSFYTLRYLSPHVDYTFKVLALTAAGPGKWSNEVNNRTKIGGK